MFWHQTINAFQTGLLYSLIGLGFFLASRSTRHFAFASVIAFLVPPYAVLSVSATTSVYIGIVVGLLGCMGGGVLYYWLARGMARGGARQGELLIVSLAVMGVAEQGVVVLFGANSITLLPSGPVAVWEIGGVAVATQRWMAILGGAATLAVFVAWWFRARGGALVRALLDSPLNLRLRGWSVTVIEAKMAAVGFLLVGIAGTLWALDGRIRPSMCTDIGVVGAAVVIVGERFHGGVVGLIVGAGALAVIKVVLSGFFEGDWAMTSLLLLLLGSLVVSGAGLRSTRRG